MSISKLLLVFLILSVSSTPILTSHAAEGENAVASAIEEAEETIVLAYEAVLDAEEAGADVSGLLARLNVAGEALANAYISYKIGDSGDVTRFANLCREVGLEVRNEAVELENEKQVLWLPDLWLRITISIVGVVSVIFLSVLVWRAIERRYIKNVLGSKPVVPDEA